MSTTTSPSVLRIQHVSVPMPPGGEVEARRFYGGALGLDELTPPTALADLALVWFDAGDGHEVHCFTDERLGASAPAQHLCLEVDGIDAFRARLAERAVAIEETTPVRNRPRFFVRDPFGNLIEITEVRGEYD